MLKDDTIVIELSGVMGAGYLPGLHIILANKMRDRFKRLEENKKPKELVTRFYVDNTNAIKNDPKRRERMTDLIIRVNDLTEAEWSELTELIRWSEELFRKDLLSFPKPIDIVFRRGGKIQDFVLLPESRLSSNLPARFYPLIQIFLSAAIDTIKQTYASDEDVKSVIDGEPSVYCSSAERANEQQNEWLKRLRDFGNISYLERKTPSKDVFADYILSKISGKLLGLDLIPKRSVFISYSSKDELFVKQLYNDLEKNGVNCWYAPDHLTIGEKTRLGIDKAIRQQDKLLLILSQHSVESDWVEKEVETAMEWERSQKRLVIFPVRLDDSVMEIEDGWPADIRRARNIGNFCNWQNPDGYQITLNRVLRDLR